MEKIFSIRLGSVLESSPAKLKDIQEIRLRSGQPLMIRYKGQNKMLDETGAFCSRPQDALCVLPEDIQESLAYMCQYSLYAYEDQIRGGYITIRGGHRVGVSGQTVIKNGKVQSITHISSLNIRISHQIKGCGEKIFPCLWEAGHPCHTLIISPPGGGKTTLLRDFIRLFSNGLGAYSGMNVALIDERSEVAASYMGKPQNDVGMRTDVLDGCPKAEGIGLMLRSMGPQVIAFDELGGQADFEALRHAVYSGCTALTTMHGLTMEDVRQRLNGGGSLFTRYIFLDGGTAPGHIVKVLDNRGAAAAGGV